MPVTYTCACGDFTTDDPDELNAHAAACDAHAVADEPEAT